MDKTGLVVKNRGQFTNLPNKTMFNLWAVKKMSVFCVCAHIYTRELAWKQADWKREPACIQDCAQGPSGILDLVSWFTRSLASTV